MLASFVGAAIAAGFLLVLHVNSPMVVLAGMIKFADNGADLSFGLNILRFSTGMAMRRLLLWSSIRLLFFAGGTAGGLSLGQRPSRALLIGATLNSS